MTNSNLQPGDAIERAGPLGTKHRGIFVGFDSLGRAWVIHNAKNECVKWDLLIVFAAGFPVTVASRIATSLQEQRMIVARAQSLLGKKYDLVNFNCDHLVNYSQAGVVSSPQLQIFALLGALAVLIGVAASKRA